MDLSAQLYNPQNKFSLALVAGNKGHEGRLLSAYVDSLFGLVTPGLFRVIEIQDYA